MKIRKGDKVRVLAGKDRGREGTVTEARPRDNKVIVEGINTARRHKKAVSAEDTGGIIDIDMPIHVSNVAVLSPKDGEPTRVGYKVDDDGVKQRICKRTGEIIEEKND